MIKRMRPILGTYVEIAAHHATADEIAVTENALQIIQHIHDLMSFQQPDSDLSRLNLARRQGVEVHSLTAQCLKLAKAMAMASDHLFNPTIGGTLVARQVLPDHGFADYLPIGDVSAIAIHGRYIRLHQPILLCLDGIAKGFAIDCAVQYLQRAGCAYGWVNAGGDIRVFGNTVLPIRLRGDGGEEVGIGAIQHCAIASSVARPQHDDDFPAMLVAKHLHYGRFSVLAHKAWRADALTKVACALDVAQAQQCIAQLGGHLIVL